MFVSQTNVLGPLPVIVSNSFSNKDLDSYEGAVDSVCSVAVAVVESSCFVWGFGSNKGMPCKRLNPRFEEKVALVSFIHAPKDKSVFGLVVVSSEGRMCVWEDVTNNPVDHFYNLVSPFNPGETPLKIVEIPKYGCLISSSSQVFKLRVFDKFGVLSISFSEIRKPGNAIFSQMTRMLGLSGSPADEITNICISSNVDALFINSGESIERWSISSDYEFQFQNQFPLKQALQKAFLKMTNSRISDCDILDMNFHHQSDCVILLATVAGKLYSALIKTEAGPFKDIQLRELDCSIEASENFLKSFPIANSLAYIVIGSEQIHVISDITDFDSDDFSIPIFPKFGYLLDASEYGEDLVCFSTSGVLKAHLNLKYFQMKSSRKSSVSSSRNAADKVRLLLEKSVIYGQVTTRTLEVGEDLNNAVISLSYDLLNSRLIEVSGELGDIGSIMKFKAKHFNLFSCIGNMERMVSAEAYLCLLNNMQLIIAGDRLWGYLDVNLKAKENGSLRGAFSVDLIEKFMKERNILLQDHLRSFFKFHLSMIPELLNFTFRLLAEEKAKGSVKNLAMILCQAISIYLILEPVISFNNHIGKEILYTLRDSSIWFMEAQIVQEINELFDFGLKTFAEFKSMVNFDYSKMTIVDELSHEVKDPDSPVFVYYFADQLKRLAQVILNLYEFRFLGVNSMPEEVKKRKTSIIMDLSSIGLKNEALAYGEAFEDYTSLIRLTHSEQRDRDQRLSTFDDYTKRFGDAFAFELFNFLLENGMLSDLLDCSELVSPILGNYFSSNQNCSLSWIQDIQSSHFEQCSEHCFNWNSAAEDLRVKKFSLSLTKLASSISGHHVAANLDINLYMLSVQDEILWLLHNFDDNSSEANVTSLTTSQYLMTLIEKITKSIALKPLELFDLLTLRSYSNEFQSFAKAYKIVDYFQDVQTKNTLIKVLWRRAYSSPNWPYLEKTINVSSDEKRITTLKSTHLYTFLTFAQNNNLQVLPLSSCHPNEEDRKIWMGKESLGLMPSFFDDESTLFSSCNKEMIAFLLSCLQRQQ